MLASGLRNLESRTLCLTHCSVYGANQIRFRYGLASLHLAFTRAHAAHVHRGGYLRADYLGRRFLRRQYFGRASIALRRYGCWTILSALLCQGYNAHYLSKLNSCAGATDLPAPEPATLTNFDS